MDIGNWDDEDFEVPTPANKVDDFDDLIQFADSLTLQADGSGDEGNSAAAANGNGVANGEKEELCPLPSDTIDLTRNRGVLLKRVESSSSTKSDVKPSEDKPFVELHYEGFLVSTGERFDSSRDQNYAMIVRLDLPPSGQSSLIAGLELALRELSPGEKATATIKSAFAYGEKGADDIPPNSDLRFELEIIDVRAAHKRGKEPVDTSKSDLSRLEDIRKEREVAQQRREEEERAKIEEKERKAQRAAQLREKIANKKKGGPKNGKKGGKKKK